MAVLQDIQDVLTDISVKSSKIDADLTKFVNAPPVAPIEVLPAGAISAADAQVILDQAKAIQASVDATAVKVA